jgi:hypothetical protein
MNNKLTAIFTYLRKNYTITLFLLLTALLVLLIIFKCYVAPDWKANTWDRIADPALTLVGLLSPLLIWLYFVNREWRGSLDEKLIVHFYRQIDDTKQYVMSAYNVNLVKGGDIRTLAQQVGQQMSYTQFLVFNPSIRTLKSDEVFKTLNAQNKTEWVRCQEVEILLYDEPEGDTRKNLIKPLLGKYVVWNYFENDKKAIIFDTRPTTPWHLKERIAYNDLLSLDAQSEQQFVESQTQRLVSKNTLYLLNSPICTDYGCYDYVNVDTRTAKSFLEKYPNDKVISAIGHEGTAQYLSALFEQTIENQRIEVQMQAGDQAIVIKIPRQAIGTNLDIETLKTLNPSIGIMTRLK